MDHVGQRIRKIREDKGIKQNALARFAGVSGNTLYLIEHGERNPSLSTLERIAGALGVHTSELFPKDLTAINLPPVRSFALETVEANVIEAVRPKSRVELNESIEKLLANHYSESDLLELRRNSLNRVDELTPEREERLDEYSAAVSTANLASRVLERIGAKDPA
jgi:transcriptional regulator with XRE-family HTH domain